MTSTFSPLDNKPTTSLVSIIMPMHNSAVFVESSIRSVLAQTIEHWELIVVNDRSDDGSQEIVQAISSSEPRIRLLHNPGAQGAAHARNHGTRYARGRFIAFLDSDDMWLPNKLEKQLGHIDSTGTPLTYGGYYKIRRDERVDPINFTPTRRIVRPPAELTYSTMLRQDYIGFLTAMYDTEAIGKRFFPPLKRRQDYAMLLEIFRTGITASGIQEPLAIYREAGQGSLSSNKLRAARYNWHLYRNAEGLPFHRALWSFCNYAVRSGLKYLI